MKGIFTTTIMRFFGFLLLLLGCGCTSETRESGATSNVLPVPASFFDFYERFHQDSFYQLQHIQFPLDGKSGRLSTGNQSDSTHWKRSEWKLHRPVDFSQGQYQQELAVLGSYLILERITHRTGRFRIERRFARLDEEWYLIYYANQFNMTF